MISWEADIKITLLMNVLLCSQVDGYELMPKLKTEAGDHQTTPRHIPEAHCPIPTLYMT
jgi:hypothetical protein